MSAMITVLIVIAVLVVLILVALKFGLGKKEAQYTGDAEERQPIIHMSGIYSVATRSPREDLLAMRPREMEIRSYLDGVSEDLFDTPLSFNDKSDLLKDWKARIEANLQEIEAGDKNGTTFYYYDFPKPCPVCADFVTKGNFVTREEIYKNPGIIPPFHLGCTCVLAAHQGSESKLRDTVLVGVAPFLEGSIVPTLPDWMNIVSLSMPLEARG